MTSGSPGRQQPASYCTWKIFLKKHAFSVLIYMETLHNGIYIYIFFFFFFIILQHHVSTWSSCCGDSSNKRILTKNVKMNV